MKCPFCSEDILDGAIKCKHCGSMLTKEAPPLPYQNSSASGKGFPVPKEIRKWNWGAFLLTIIWGIGNKTYISLLTLIPIFGFIMAFVLGAKGSEWAWRNKEWEGVAHFRRVQKKWARAGLIVLLAVLVPAVVGISLAIFIPQYEAYQKRAAQHRANSEYKANKLRPASNQVGEKSDMMLDKEGRAIQLVKNGYFTQYKNKSVGEAVDTFFGYPEWQSEVGVEGDNKETTFVYAKGIIRNMEKEAEAKLTFLVDMNGVSFELHSFEMNGVPQDPDMIAGLLQKMYQ